MNDDQNNDDKEKARIEIEEELYRQQLKSTHSTPPEYSKVGKTIIDCYCSKCGRKCTKDNDICPNCHSTQIKCYYSSI